MKPTFGLSARESVRSILVAGFVATSFSAAAAAQHTQRVSLSNSGGDGNAASFQLSFSADGRFAAFSTYATNFGSGVSNNPDVFLRDRVLGVTTWISRPIGGGPTTGSSLNPAISRDGRFVVFESDVNNLVPGDSPFSLDVFLWDAQTGALEGISYATGGTQLVGGHIPAVSGDGRYVAFESESSILVPGDTNGVLDVFVRDRQLGTTERINLGPGGVEGDGPVFFNWPFMSADARFVVFTSAATNMVPGDTNGKRDVFLRDRTLGTTEIVSVDALGNLGNGDCSVSTVSADGRYVLFESTSTNLVPGDTNGVQDVFLRDRLLGTVERVNLDSAGLEANAICHVGYYGEISDDGRFVGFSGAASNLVPGDTNGRHDAFLRDRLTGTTERLSVSSTGAEGTSDSLYPAVSSDGRFACFLSHSPNLVPGDTNQFDDVFVRDRSATSFTTFCDPGAGGVIPCPCANPPSGAGRGCDNFGAGPFDSGTLGATGAAYLSDDSVVLQATGENNTSLTVFFAGTATVPGGFVLGAGVRCVGGNLRRLYTAAASGGAVARPGPGDPSVSTRSATAGTPISPGQTRYYLGVYRDPLAAGPCGDPASTVNATSAGAIAWSW